MDVLGKILKSVTSESVTSEASPPSILGRQGYPENIIKFDHPYVLSRSITFFITLWNGCEALPKRFVPKSVFIFGNLVKISNISGK